MAAPARPGLGKRNRPKAKAKVAECKSRKIALVMREFHSGRLKAKGGARVQSRSRALAIAYAEARARCGGSRRSRRSGAKGGKSACKCSCRG